MPPKKAQSPLGSNKPAAKPFKRMTTDEALDSIFRPKTEEKNTAPAANVSTFYVVQGGSNKKDNEGNYVVDKENDDAVCAKHIVKDGKERFLIKSDGHSFYNPMGMYSIYDKTPGVKRWRFEQVQKPVFEAYKTFLRSKSEVFLQHAELLYT